MAGLAHAVALSGNQGEARKILAELLARSKRGYYPPGAIASVYIGLGDKDRAFQWLREAAEQRDQFVLALKSSFLYDPIRSDPRFPDLLRRLNLAP